VPLDKNEGFVTDFVHFKSQAAEILATLASVLCSDASDENSGIRPSTNVG
jgi:hypothetical protein